MVFNELKKGQRFVFPENPKNEYQITFKGDSSIHFSGVFDKATYIILKEYLAWVAIVKLS